jgi:hypothetical protein
MVARRSDARLHQKQLGRSCLVPAADLQGVACICALPIFDLRLVVTLVVLWTDG